MREFLKKASEKISSAAKTGQESIQKLKENPQVGEFVKKAVIEKEKLAERLKKEKQQINERYTTYSRKTSESQPDQKKSESSFFDKWSQIRDKQLSERIESSARKAKLWISIFSRGAKDSNIGDKIKSATSSIFNKAQDMDLDSKMKTLKEKASGVIPNKDIFNEGAQNIKDKAGKITSTILNGTRKTSRSFAFYFLSGIFLYALGSNIPQAYVNYRNYKYQAEMLEEKLKQFTNEKRN